MKRYLVSMAVFVCMLFAAVLLAANSAGPTPKKGKVPGPGSAYRGDINESGSIDIFDLTAMLKLLADPVGQTERARQIADVDASGKVDIFDLLGLLKLLSGAKEPELIYFTAEPEGTEFIQGVTMVAVPGGSFQMGSETGESSEQPVHTVALDAFWISVTEVTQRQYKAVLGERPSHFTGNDSLPVEQVSWFDAVTFCNTLSSLAGLEPCYDLETWECDFTKNGFRLPTEAEWEYACRAGSSTRYYTGDEESDLERAGWYAGNSGESTHPVGQKEANGWGLFDMHGNVFEWCNDWWGSYNGESLTNPTGPVFYILSIHMRILRGGCWYVEAEDCRSAARTNSSPSTKSDFIGFRVVRRGAALPVPTYNLQGSILEGGVGVPGVVVHVSGSGMDIVLASGPDGSYGFSGLAEGKYRIVFSISDSKYAPEDGVELTVDRDLRVDVIQGITLVSIPAGSFQMGGPGFWNTEPVHTVTLRVFKMSATEITQAQYQAVMHENPSPDYYIWDPNLPVLTLPWYDAARFCNALSVMAGLDSCYNLETWEYDFRKNGFRLPTEAEWEYACRAGTTTRYYTGDEESDLDRAGWYLDNSGHTFHPVGQKEPNAWGLYDMHGNASEWCNDWFYSYYSAESQSNPVGRLRGSLRSYRGGHIWMGSEYCIAWRRFYKEPEYPDPEFISPDLTLRVVRRVKAAPTYNMNGVVLHDGKGLDGVAVQAYGNGVDTALVSGADGGYSLSGLADGTYLIIVSKSYYTFTPEGLEVTINGSDLTVNITAQASVPVPGPVETEEIQGITLASLPAGSFQMGQEGESVVPVHTVTLDAFWIGQTEITQNQYQAVMGVNPSYFRGSDSLSVEGVGWDDAVEFCNRLSELARFAPCYNLETRECDFTKNGFRLPTEAEWEYACRAGTKSYYCNGYFESDLARVGWYKVNSVGTTHPVGQKEPNAWGLYDMHGNVREWCNDSPIHYTSESQTNPTGGPFTDIRRLLRGGSYNSLAFSCVSYVSGFMDIEPSHPWKELGFRVVRRK
ncbi:MAG TPA: SUMF1/EgtB/PvdO family nonheme iron enzyme [archaeon]|nr:SUMF1/EgtB/PvdO family nonheme iron enzyme [archaeon]